MAQSWNRQQLDGRQVPTNEKLALLREAAAQRKKVAEGILAKPKRKDINKARR